MIGDPFARSWRKNTLSSPHFVNNEPQKDIEEHERFYYIITEFHKAIIYTINLRKVGSSVMLAVPPALLDVLHLTADAKVGLAAVA
ncbi:AbrB/MazE/SpoVT family DNA-binding domain-containing protein [Acidiphilium sp. MT5]